MRQESGRGGGEGGVLLDEVGREGYWMRQEGGREGYWMR